jgi:hypothetical protein
LRRLFVVVFAASPDTTWSPQTGIAGLSDHRHLGEKPQQSSSTIQALVRFHHLETEKSASRKYKGTLLP